MNLKSFRIDDPIHLIRQRTTALFADASKNPVITVCAGVGCGKTRAVYDFLRHRETPVFWMQISERDNEQKHYWQNIVETFKQLNKTLAARCEELGFPDTPEKINRFLQIKQNELANKPFIIVLDNLHLLNETSVLQLTEEMVNTLTPNLTIILIYRDMPKINIEILQLKGFVSEVFESDLAFNESELLECFKQQGLNLDSQTIREVHRDTSGWAFAANLVVRSLKKVPIYSGFVKTTLKKNLFKLIEAENWNALPLRLKRFLIRLSLIDRLSMELVEILTKGDKSLIVELQKQSAYIRFDSYGGAYLFHHLYLEFLRSKQDDITVEERYDTFKAAADWCKRNGFKKDALDYYEKIEDYDSIVTILWGRNETISYDIALHALGIFERTPKEVFSRVSFYAATHLLVLLCMNRQSEFISLADAYEQQLTTFPEKDTFRNHTLGGVYFFWGCMRYVMSTHDDRYDFNFYFKKAAECLTRLPKHEGFVVPIGPWCSAVGNVKAGATEEFAKAVTQMAIHFSSCFSDVRGLDCLCWGELMYYQNDIRAAEPFILQALESSHENKQYEIGQMAHFYSLRISILQGNRKNAVQILKDIKTRLDEEAYSRRFMSYDIISGWYSCVIRQPEKVPDWLKGEFVPYVYANFIDNFGNQIRARYHYLTRNFRPLLSYIKEMKKRESTLYGRVEMLAMEACIRYQMKNKLGAWISFKEAFTTAMPNNIIMPFIELGKDMRTLVSTFLREQPDLGIPRTWLESLKHKATSYAKNQSTFITENKTGNSNNKILSARENDVLNDLYHGFSQAEIASKRSLSVNTIKMVTKSIYDKLHVHKISDLVRIAAEQGLV
jgi:LuxR family maltose regulon positive regulatory protein